MRILYSGNESVLGGDMSSSPVMAAAHDNDNALSPVANVTNSPVAIVTSTRPVSSQIICPPTPQLVQFDKALDLESQDQL
jgi:methylglyoxal synthase